MTASALAPVRTLGQVRRWCSTSTWGSARWQRGLAAVIAAIIFWPQASVDPIVGGDPSWQAALALVRIHHLAWGPEITGPYGPLTFLGTTGYYSFDQTLLATIYQPIIVAALFLGVAAALRQRRAPMTSLVGAFVTTGIVAFLYIGHGGAPGLEYPELAVLVAFAWAAVPLLQDDPKRSSALKTCIVLGAFAGFQLLVKFNIGVAIVAIAVAVSVLLDWRAVGRHCSTVSAFAASTLILWLLAGQRPGNLHAWIKSSANVITGYGGVEGDFTLLGVVAVLVSVAWIGALAVMFVRGGPEVPRRFLALVGLATVISAKYAITKGDIWHLFVLLGLIVVTVAITPLSRTRGRAFVVVVAGIVVVLLCAEAVVVHAFAYYPERAGAALQAPGQAVDRLVTLALPGRVDQRVKQAKARQRALYAIPDRFIKTIGSGTVHIDPIEASAAWAYDLTWRPTPAYQAAAGFTPVLDALNTESLAAGPQFVLSRLSPASPAIGIVGMGGQLGVQQSPRYSRALLCNFAASGVENRWALFTHTSPHCGPLTAVSQVTVHEHDVITVPTPSGPDMAVLVGIDLQPTIVDRLFPGTVAPLATSIVTLDGVSYRLTVANAAEPFLVNTPESANGTNLQIHAHTIGVGRTLSIGQHDVAARLRFYEMRVEPTVTITQPGPGQPTIARTGEHTPPPASPKSVIDANGTSWQVIDSDGTYVMGVDVYPGRYRSAGGPKCYWARLRSSDTSDIIDDKKTNGWQVVEIRGSDTAFVTQNCGTWQQIP